MIRIHMTKLLYLEAILSLSAVAYSSSIEVSLIQPSLRSAPVLQTNDSVTPPGQVLNATYPVLNSTLLATSLNKLLDSLDISPGTIEEVAKKVKDDDFDAIIEETITHATNTEATPLTTIFPNASCSVLADLRNTTATISQELSKTRLTLLIVLKQMGDQEQERQKDAHDLKAQLKNIDGLISGDLTCKTLLPWQSCEKGRTRVQIARTKLRELARKYGA